MTPRWYFDFISPYSYLQWRRLRDGLEEHGIEPVPILFAAILEALGNRGPAEIPGKREFAYRHILWRARRAHVPLRFPPAHPFNPLAALRLAIAAGNSRAAIDAVFDWIWAQGNAGDSVEALAPVLERLQLRPEALAAPEVKAALHANTSAAVAAGVFGVPTLALGDDLFWGDDAHDFAMAALQDPELLDDPEMRRLASLPVGIRRG
ncbi:2-hydroxychromene-2-carboxylate isomerase [Luteimonas sp. SJ-92]|uniref:2-hydroxychromene-2-carboxylate isomerase n=1 Tax=Luteimonas salinisoli TaxID=2752307 RepID=A0A853JF95_9GAMM|nr:2-hydroxychromene-2-carboxylate isomerase [Luteimonas salinisoli]NZA27267.1 2-hydroxychromene-2-carboxylate isomerase [Luteimonas salinisoli]